MKTPSLPFRLAALLVLFLSVLCLHRGTAADAPPAITGPLPQTVSVGATAAFAVSSTNPGPLSCRWRKNGVNLTDGERVSGSTTATLTITGVQTADVGDYSVVVSNSAGSTNSQPARLILEQPAHDNAPALVWIPPGTFMMGSPTTEHDRGANEGPQTQVTLTKGFWMGKYEVTQGEYLAVMGVNPSYFAWSLDRPVDQVIWSEATNYSGALTTRERAAGRLPAGYVYRLPTEAEWEYACRAGTTTRLYFGEDSNYSLLPSYEWVRVNSGAQTHPVGQKLPNPWGLYDMNGNVLEWCMDWYADSYLGGSVVNPTGPENGTAHVYRVGCWDWPNAACSSAARGSDPGYRSWGFGFRIVLAHAEPLDAAPRVVDHPQSQTAALGSSVSFVVSAAGLPPLSYQWRKNGVNLADGGRISGATTTNLTIRLVQGADAGSYDVVVSNAVGSATSQGAVLAVPNAPPDVPGMIWIPPGRFTMGSPDTENGRDGDEGPTTAVTISRGFFISSHPVTQGQYEAIAKSNPSSFKGLAERPVENVTWFEATNYCAVLTAQELEAGRLPIGYVYRLPTEAEWEYVARAGSTTRFSWGDDPTYASLGDYAWYSDNSGGTTHPVGQKQPSRWGLYDMVGNALTWCWDWYGPTLPGGNVIDPVGPASGPGRVDRGCGWNNVAPQGRSAKRSAHEPQSRNGNVGIRVVLAPDPNARVAPSVSAHPQSQTVGIGANMTFTVAATGSPPLTYQWRKGGVNLADGGRISGATTTNLTIRLVQGTDAGNYDVVVSNAIGSAASQAAVLAVPNAPPDVAGMIWIPPGTFTMGSPDSEQDRNSDEGPQTVVTLTRGFWMGRYEVTQGEYVAVMGSNPSSFTGDLNRPVEQVSWIDATNYCATLTAQERSAGRLPAGWAYRLPTEAEWEYAARAGTTTRFSYGDDPAYSQLVNHAWYSANAGGQTHAVGQKQANPWGLNDMYGNVWEWCWDWYGTYPGGSLTDPIGPASGSHRVLRGGSWSGVGRFCPSAYRGNNTPDYRSGNFGFRAVLTADPNAPVAPSISAHPQSQTVGAGTNVVFTVAATGSPPLTYQWRKDGVNLAGGGRISGATTTSLTIRLVQGADAGNYDVVVNNAVGSATSEGAVLATPNAPPDVPGMIWIPSGTFTMGSPATEQDRSGNEGPQTVVTLTKGFWMGRYEVTQAEYLSVMGSNPSSFTGDLNRPVERVNWYEATDYCGRLTAQERAAGRLPTGWAYRLPTEAEWEYAARAGTAARFSYGDDPGYTQLGNYAWYPANSGSQTHAVGQKQPNPWGLYDMAGNVWEWCLGWYATYPGGSVSDPVGPVSGSDRLLRGGSWGDGGARYCRSASRNNNTPDSRHLSIGFRAVLTADLNPPVPPSVSAHPQSRTVGAGTNVVFTVAATGTPPLTYQWRKGGVNLADGGRVNGVTTTNLTITSVQISDAGSYDVVVSNAAGSTNSQPATLAVSAFRFLVNGQPAQRRVVVLPSPTVEIQGPYSDWLVFYTLDDTLPSESNLLYQGAFTLDQAATVYPIAFAPDFSDQLLGDPLVVAFFSTQTIAVTPVSGLKYGDPAVTLQATASSGLPITWSLVSGPAQLQGSLLTPTGAGTVVVRASQAGSDVFAPAQASLTIDVARAPQTISWAQLPNRTFGDAAFAVGATASSGLPVAFELVSGPAQVTGTQVTLTGGGTVVLRARQDGNANYLAAQLDNSFTVAKAAQTLTFAALPDRVFSPNPIPLVASASSGLPITFAVLTGPATLAGGQLTLTGVGRVTVQASQPGNDSYLAAAASDRSFNVSQATQTLVFDAVPAKTYGDAPVALKATSNAGLTPVTYALVSGPGQLTGTQLTLLGAGVIVVQAQQAGDARYASAQAQLRIDVAQAAQTITFAALADMAYSTNRIPLAATASSGLPVVYTVVSGAAALADTNSLVLTTNVGPVQVRASQAGNSNYLAALSVTNTFTVSRGPQTIDFKAIGDQVLGVPPLTLVATASSGLPVSFELIGGPATLSAGKLTLLNEGAVTVRAVQVGSRLYLAAPPVEQTFQVRRMTLLLVAAGPGGKVTRNPDNADNLYTPGASVLLTATPDAGFAFAGWSGDTNTTQNPLTVIMNGSLSLSAGFRDAQSPQVSITRPATGATADERATLEGLITDNVGVTSARWERDGQGQGTLALVNGAFSVASLRLHRGDNLFRVIAADAAGNEGSASVVATWAPDRTLSAENPPEQREGKKLTVPLSLISQGDVGGMSFVLHYDADYLRDPWVEWSAVTGASANTVNSNTPGEVRATFSLAGLAVPPGTQLVASVTFRARSVPFDLLTDLSVELLDVSGPNSQTYLYGADTVDAQARILKRRMLGDNNANQRLDVGDATLIQRLLTHLDPVRAWDVSLNDLNANSALDSGDVTKVLRVVVGLDPQPGLLPLMPAEEELVTSEKAATTVLPLPGGEGRGEGEVSRLLIPTSQPSLRTRAVHPQSAGTTPSEAALLLPLLLTGKPGDLVKLEVALTNIQGQLAGAFFRLDYPIDALRLLNASSHTQGAMVPSGAALLWNVAPDQNNYVTQTGRVSFAASSASAWPSANGVLAELTFQVQPGASSQAGWPIRLSGVEVTADGFENRSLADALVMFGAAIQPPVIDVGRSGMGQDGFKLVIIGQPGSRYEVQFCDDLEHWTLLTTIVNVTGTVETVDPTLTPVFRRFYRVKQTSP